MWLKPAGFRFVLRRINPRRIFFSQDSTVILKAKKSTHLSMNAFLIQRLKFYSTTNFVLETVSSPINFTMYTPLVQLATSMFNVEFVIVF